MDGGFSRGASVTRLHGSTQDGRSFLRVCIWKKPAANKQTEYFNKQIREKEMFHTNKKELNKKKTAFPSDTGGL